MVKCHLEFTEFSKFCQELIGKLHGSDDFTDIALMGDDNRQFKAHKFLLRAHSNVIRDVLSSSSDVEKPLLYFKGFNSQDIQFLLDFMYLGETSCEPKNVNVFFKTGKFLQIKQLVEECEDDVETLNERFSLEVLDQFCDIIGDSEVKAEEINQIENEIEFREEGEYKEKEISKELHKLGENEDIQMAANKQKISKAKDSNFTKVNGDENMSPVTAQHNHIQINENVYKCSSRARKRKLSGAITNRKEILIDVSKVKLEFLKVTGNKAKMLIVTQNLMFVTLQLRIKTSLFLDR